jgi:nucleoside-diphosphate-sugar epimerase
MEIDLYREDLGLSRDYIDQLARETDGIWHLAADLSFEKRDREKIFSTNVNGLKNILRLAGQLKCPVYYTSTAYVHGDRPGLIFEDELLRPKSFNNPYEESKFDAEKIVREWGKENESRFIIFRPSIFIETRGRTTSFFGYYAVINSLYKFKKRYDSKKPIRILIPFPYSESVFLNLIPVETAITWMLEISSNPMALGRVFHITNPRPFAMRTIVKEAFEALDIEISVVSAPKWFIKFCFYSFYIVSFLVRPTKGLAKKFYYYRYYMTEYNVYDMRNTSKFIKQSFLDQFNFSPGFIERITKDFIRRLETSR